VSNEDQARELASRFEAARAAFPTIELSREAFDAHVLAAAGSHGLSNLHTNDLYLACACAAGDARAIATFEAQLFGAVSAMLARMAMRPDDVEAVKQGARIKLFSSSETGRRPVIADYSGRGPLKAWFRVTIVRDALSALRKVQREVAVEHAALLGVSGEGSDPELRYLRTRYGQDFESAFRDALAALSPHERNLLRHHYLDRLSIDEIGALYRIHRMTAARHLTRVRAALVDSIKGLLRERLQLSDSEVRSVLRLLQSHVDMSLGGLLGPGESEPASTQPTPRKVAG
jgi:RNA polymerase sigma-70 factor, ECF subfamily